MAKGDGRGGKRAGAGRPKGTRAPLEERRRHRVPCNLNDGELAALDDVREDGESSPEVLRRGLRALVKAARRKGGA